MFTDVKETTNNLLEKFPLGMDNLEIRDGYMIKH